MEDQEHSDDGRKRFIGTVDLDYLSKPDSKKIKLLQVKGEEEFHDRVVKVVEEKFSEAIIEKSVEIDEIDERILKVQQALNTLRYCVSLNIYAYGKLNSNSESYKSRTRLNHPTIQRHLGVNSKSSDCLPTSEPLSICNEKLKDDTKANQPGAAHKSHPSSPRESSETKANTEETVGLSPSKHQVISQGRRGLFQKKIRVVVGNTYQYIKDSDVVNDKLNYKWRVYVRGSQESPDVTEFISSIQFTLDKSYAPDDVIVLRNGPFTLSRRGWGEFKIYLKLTFKETRNKPIQLLHSLTLARPDDPLAFTGLWRLGKEIWYDIWLYDKSDDSANQETEAIIESRLSEDELISNLLDKGIKSDTIFSDSEGNFTLSHNSELFPMFSSEVNEDVARACNISDMKVNKIVVPCEDENKKKLVNDTKHDFKNTENSVNDTQTNNLSNSSSDNYIIESKEDKKMSKIYIRQPDGSLLPLNVPQSMYNIAKKLSNKSRNNDNVTQSNTNKFVQTGSLVTPNGLTSARIVPPTLINSNNTLVKGKHILLNSSNPRFNIRGRTLIELRGHVPLPQNAMLKTANGNFFKLNPIPSTSISGTQASLSANLNQPTPTLLNIANNLYNKNPSNVAAVTNTTSLGSNATKLPVCTFVDIKSNKVLPVSNQLAGKVVGVPIQKFVLTKRSLNASNAFTCSVLPGSSTLTPSSVVLLKSTTANSDEMDLTSSNKIIMPKFIVSNPEHLMELNKETEAEKVKKKNGKRERIRGKKEEKEKKELKREQTLEEKYENWKKALKLGNADISAEELIRLMIKRLPLHHDGENVAVSHVFSRLPTAEEFKHYPVGKRRAFEFWRAREIHNELLIQKPQGYREWSTIKIVSWSRKRGHTPVSNLLDMSALDRRLSYEKSTVRASSLTTLSPKYRRMLYQNERRKDVSVMKNDPNELVIKVDSDEDDVEPVAVDVPKNIKKEGSGVSIDPILIPNCSEESNFVKSVTSRVRIKLEPQEMVPGVQMEVASTLLWRASMCLMEDILRSAYSETHSPKKNLEINSSVASDRDKLSRTEEAERPGRQSVDLEGNHVLQGILNGRKQFRIFTNYGLGKSRSDVSHDPM